MANDANITRQNHYVPEWYQKQFLIHEQHLHLLDLNPDSIKRPDGLPVINNNGKIKQHNARRDLAPSQCFLQYDLYTTSLLGRPNDIIEKRLFGFFDNYASNLLPIFIEKGWESLRGPEEYQTIFNYIDIQRLRTPAGLDFIKYIAFKKFRKILNQEILMNMMQELQYMHRTMWAESVREIVSAEESDIKFIVSDHPVVFYNYKAFPGSVYCRYPLDPMLTWQGTQTLFVTDPNHCMIFTHLDFAKNPDTTNPLKDRINGRYFSQTIESMHNWIRKRKLKREEVSVINYIIKKRAKRYIAAGNPDWLYPEKTAFNVHWSKLRRITLPKHEIYRFGGEIYLGYEDDRVYQQDAYGRQTMSQKEARNRAAEMQSHLEKILAQEELKKKSEDL